MRLNQSESRTGTISFIIVCIFLYFTEILREILTSLETLKQQQHMILLQLQNNFQRPVEVPEVSGFPLTW